MGWEWIWFSAGVIIGILATILVVQSTCLPAWTRKWLDRIGPTQIIDSIERVAAITDLSPEARRKQAVIYLQNLTIKEFGFPVPESIGNLLVEFIYQPWKRRRM